MASAERTQAEIAVKFVVRYEIQVRQADGSWSWARQCGPSRSDAQYATDRDGYRAASWHADRIRAACPGVAVRVASGSEVVES